MNIWSIRNRQLRAATAWLIALLAVALFILCLPLLTAWLIIAGICGSIHGAWVDVMDCREEWRNEIIKPFWRAATGKDE